MKAMSKLIVGPYSRFALIPANKDTVHLSGHIGNDAETGKLVSGGFSNQVKQAFNNLSETLEMAEIGKENIVKATVFLTDMSNFDEMNKLYVEYLGEHRPARSCVAVKQLPKGADFEIEAIAYK